MKHRRRTLDRFRDHYGFISNLRFPDPTWRVTKAVSLSPTTAASAHTMGTWVAVTTSAPYHVHGIFFKVTHNATSTNSSCMMEIGIGGSGAEVQHTIRLPVGYAASRSFYVPGFWPAGTRISVRVGGARTSTAVNVTAALYSPPANVEPLYPRLPAAQSMIVLSGVTNSIGDLTITANNTWVEVASSLVVPLAGVWFGLQGNGSTTLANNGPANIELGIGPSGSEITIATFACRTTTAEIVDDTLDSASAIKAFTDEMKCCFRHIPLGTRLAIRRTATLSTVDVVVQGIIIPADPVPVR